MFSPLKHIPSTHDVKRISRVVSILIRRLGASIAFALIAFVPAAAGQGPGTIAAERLRLAQITGGDSSPRTTDTLRGIGAVLPAVRVVSNSRLPFPGNDGALWAGRGVSGSVTGGGRGAWWVRGLRLRAAVAPTVWMAQNLEFQIRPLREDPTNAPDPTRSPFSSPWHTGIASADLPLRFGDGAISAIDPGESYLALSGATIEVGAATTSMWWGPGRRNALLISDNGPGIPRLYARTARPIPTPAGAFTAELISGVLTESDFFDANPTNDRRSLSAARVEWQPPNAPHLTLGLERAVFRRVGGFARSPARALDVLSIWEDLAPPGDTTAAGAPRQRADQIAGLFVRWFDPGSGLEVYGEWARLELPRSLADLFETTSHTEGFTLGLQYALKKRVSDLLNLQAEVTNLEQSLVLENRPPPSFYTGRVTAHGFTNRGQVVGAAIGPGSSSQWLAADYLLQRWQAGVFVGRLRQENDVGYRQPGFGRLSHDVTMYSGLRGALRSSRHDLSAELTYGRRYSYLFQADYGDPRAPTVDVNNLTLTFLFSPR